MAGIKINQYPLERLTFGDEDYYDIDYWTGSSYETAKIKGSVIKSGIASGLVTLYANDGALSGNRAVSGAGTNSLAFGNNVLNENLSFFKVNSTQGLEQFSSVFPITNAGLEVIKNPGNFIANIKTSATEHSQFRLQHDTFSASAFIGTNNYMHSSTPTLSSTIVSDGGAGTNSRLLLYGSGRVDLGTTGSVGAYITLDASNTFTDRNSTPKGLEYTLDYSANYTNRSLVDKEYVDNNAGGDSIYTADGTLTGNRTVDLDGNNLSFNNTNGTNSLLSLSDNAFGKISNTIGGLFLDWNGASRLYLGNGIINNKTGNFTVSNYNGTQTSLNISTNASGNLTINNSVGSVFKWGNSEIQMAGSFTKISRNGTTKIHLNNNSTIIGSGATSPIGSETISLQGSTAIKGIGTSGSSALAIYDNDTTPVKLWDFLDNGNVNGNKSKTTLTAQNLTANDLTEFVFSLKSQSGNDLMTVANDGYFQFGLSNGITGGADYSECFQVGKGNSITSNGSNKINVGIGNSISGATKSDQFIFGKSNTSNGNDQILLGQSISGGAGSGVSAVGNITTLTGSYSCALASYSNNLSNYSGILGVALESTADGAFVIGYGDKTNFNNKLVNNTADSLALGWNTTTPQYLFASTGASIDAELDMNNNRILNTVVNPSVQETTSTTTFTINADEETTGVLTAMASATTIASPTGTPVQGQSLIIRLKDDGTARAIAWNAIFRGIGITLPTTTTANKLLYIGCMYNSTDTKWDIIALKEEA